MSMKPSNISISRILMISYGIVIALFALSIAVALYGVHANASMTKEFYNRPYMVSKSAVALRFTIEEMSTYVEQLLDAENDAAKQKALVAIEDLTEQRMNELNVVRSLFKADPDLLERFSNACDELGARRNAVIGAAEAGDIDRAIDLYSNEYLAQKEVTVNLSTEVVNNAEHVAQAFVKDSFSVEVGTSLAIGLLGTAAIVLVIVMWRRITHSIAAPIQEIDRIAKRLADGDLTVRSSCTSGNELGSLASSMNETVASLRFATEQLSETAEQVARSSSQMSDSSQAVAQGSAEQATAIEELAANVQSITHVVGENTESVLTVNSNTVAALVQAELVAVKAARLGQHVRVALLKRVHVVAGDPVDALGHLLAQRGHVARHAVLALGLVRDGQHRVRVAHFVAPLVDARGARLLLVRLKVLVHRRVADGGAEARLLVPNPEAGTGCNQDNHDDAHDDRPLLSLFLGSGFLGRRALGRRCLSGGFHFGFLFAHAL